MIEIEGPYSFKDVNGLKTPAYIFLPGGEKKIIGEVSIKVSGGMTFAVDLEAEYKDIETASFDVPMRYTYMNLPQPSVNWGYNCLTGGVHHGRPEAIWNLPLLQANAIFDLSDLQKIVVTRIYNDAMQYVNRSPFIQKGTEAQTSYAKEWAEQIKTLAEEKFEDLYNAKLDELHLYYTDSAWLHEVAETIERITNDNLNSYYQPLHSHDSINMLCRILGTSCSRLVK